MHKTDTTLQICAFKTINSLLTDSSESYAWTLDLTLENIIVPCTLIFLYSSNADVRALVMSTVEFMSTSVGSAISSNVTYVELMKFILQHKEEIKMDREQLLSTLYSFLSQDQHVQSLLPTSSRFFTKKIHDCLLESVVDERVPLSVSASLIVVLEHLKDRKVIEKLIRLAGRIVRRDNRPNAEASFVVLNVLDKFHANDMEIYEQAEIRAFLEHCLLKSADLQIRTETSGVCCVGTVLLRKFAATDIYDSLKTDWKRTILNVALAICAEGEHVELIAAANSFVKKITLDCRLALPYLESMRKTELTDKAGKRRSVLKTGEWKRGIALLELMQNKKKMQNCHLVVPALFDVLQKCCEIEDELSVEYAKQVCLSCALNCSQRLTAETAGEREEEVATHRLEKLFDVELVVNCIRMSPNPQTHHHALLLLAHCATFAPNRVLHNIMAIFTFMGSSVLRQDDAFSFQIISNILETIVPLLIGGGATKTANSSVDSINSVLKVFASSIPDIPDHRRTPVLHKLMRILEEGSYLHVLVILSMECLAKSFVNDKSISGKYTEVLQELSTLFPVSVTLNCLQKLLRFVNLLPHSLGESTNECLSGGRGGGKVFYVNAVLCLLEEKMKNRSVKEIEELVNLKKYSTKELSQFRYLLLVYISNTLSYTKFINQVSNEEFFF